MNNTLKPTIEQELGRYTRQIFHFKGNVKRTFEGIDSTYIKEGSMLKLKLKDGRMLLINTTNLLMTEVFKNE